MRANSPDFVHVNYSPMENRAEERVLPLAQDRGMAVLINRPFMNGSYFGMVAGKELPAWAADFDCETWAQFSLKYVLANPAVTCVLTETTNPEHMEENIHAAFGRLPDESAKRRMRELIRGSDGFVVRADLTVPRLLAINGVGGPGPSRDVKNRRLTVLPTPSRRTLGLALVVGVGLVGPPSVEQLASPQASASLDHLAEAEIGDALPPGWSVRAVGDAAPPLTSVVRTDADAGAAPGKAIRMVAEDAAGQAWLELDDHLRPGEGLLSWRWRVDRHLNSVVLREAELDDAPARFFVAFGRRRLFGRPRLIFYTWVVESPGAIRSSRT